MNKIFI